jgi:S1-C subfamily serine protease
LAFSLNYAAADERAKSARNVMKKYQNAVISIELTVEQGMSFFGSQKSESKSEVTGTVIDTSGLTVVSLYSTDPSALLNMFMGGDMFGSEDMSAMKFESQIKDLKMIMPDGKEVPGQIVLRDKDLDLAFIRPIEKLEKPLTPVNLADAAKPALLDELVLLSRLGKVASRVGGVSLTRLEAIVEKPRIFYVIGGGSMEGGLGIPVFSLDGKIVGVIVLRTIKGQGLSLASMFSGSSGMGMLPVVLPAEDIAEIAKQAPEAKADEKTEAKETGEKDEEKKPEETQ